MRLQENINRIKEMMGIVLNEDTDVKKYYVDQSELGGKGVFAKKDLKKGETIGLLHTINKLFVDYDFTELGRMHNHKDEPNCHNEKIGNQRFLVASRDIDEGEELTTDYRLQPDLEQPQDWFKGLNEQEYKPHIDGYRTYSPFKDMDYIVVNGNGIDCDGIVWDLILLGNNNEIKYCRKNGGSVFFDKSTKVVELPIKDDQDVEEIYSSKEKLTNWLISKIKEVDNKGEINRDFL